MGLMDMIGGLFGKKNKNGGGASLPGGIQLPAGLSESTWFFGQPSVST
jgi:hypothetical protein